MGVGLHGGRKWKIVEGRARGFKVQNNARKLRIKFGSS